MACTCKPRSSNRSRQCNEETYMASYALHQSICPPTPHSPTGGVRLTRLPAPTGSARGARPLSRSPPPMFRLGHGARIGPWDLGGVPGIPRAWGGLGCLSWAWGGLGRIACSTRAGCERSAAPLALSPPMFRLGREARIGPRDLANAPLDPPGLEGSFFGWGMGTGQ